jgi:hypothetical protein|tara:strand:- start:150 stop:344 length:195 start_codon:yes stop_codon:yes gene_type:complete
MAKPESPIREKEIPHLGRAASDLGFDTVDEYLASLYQRIHQYAVECHEWNEKQKEAENEAEDTP